MKLVVHAGAHKCASTSFQILCREARALLWDAGIEYPEYAQENHNYLVRQTQQGDWAALEAFFQGTRTVQQGQGTVLISAENLENCLVDTAFAQQFQRVAVDAGFDEIEWVFVFRDPFDYLTSLYAELAKWGVVRRFDTLAKEALQKGYCVDRVQKDGLWDQFEWYFVFDADRFVADFKTTVTDRVRVYALADFTDDFVGAVFFQDYLADLAPLRAMSAVTGGARQNQRLHDPTTEYLYVANFLGIEATEEHYSNNRAVFEPLVDHRLRQMEQWEPVYRAAFKDRFK